MNTHAPMLFLFGVVIAMTCDLSCAQGGATEAPPSEGPAEIDLTVAPRIPFREGNGAGPPVAGWNVMPSKPASQELKYEQFIREVMAANLDYAAQRFNVDI